MSSILSVSALAPARDKAPLPNPGLFSIDCHYEIATLLAPLTVAELSLELYGSAQHWKTHLVPFNRYLLKDKGPFFKIKAGTEIHFSTTDLAPALRQKVSIRQAEIHSHNEYQNTLPYLVPVGTSSISTNPSQIRPPEAICPGHEIVYSLRWKRVLFNYVSTTWQAFYDPNSNEDPSRKYRSIDHFAVKKTSLKGRAFEFQTDTLGVHFVVCEAFHAGNRFKRILKQVVITPDEKAALLKTRKIPVRPARKVLNDFEKQTPKSKYKERIDEIKEWLIHEKTQPLIPVPALYFSTNKAVNTFALALYLQPINLEPKDEDGNPLEVSLKLVDLTFDHAKSYEGKGTTLDQALAQAVKNYGDDAPLPKGKVIIRINEHSLPFGNYSHKSYCVDVDNTWTISNIAGYLGIASTAVFAVTICTGQLYIAKPALFLSGVFSGASAVKQIADRYVHEDLEWDLRTGLNLIDIAGGIFALGKLKQVFRPSAISGEISILGNIEKGSDVAQIIFLGEKHRRAINIAHDTKDKNQMNKAILAALLEGAVMIAMKKLSSRLKPEETIEFVEAHNMASKGGSPPRVHAKNYFPRRPETEAFDQTIESMTIGKITNARSFNTPPVDNYPAGNSVCHRTYDFDDAYRAYELALHNVQGTREVGIYRNFYTDEFQVTVGNEVAVGYHRQSSDPDYAWEGVLHFHPGGDDVAGFRGPSQTDVASLSQTQHGRDRSEFIEYTLPGGGRGRTRYRYLDEGGIEVSYFDGSKIKTTNHESFSKFAIYEKGHEYYVDPAKTVHPDGASEHNALYRRLMWDAAEKYGHTLSFAPPSRAYSNAVKGDSAMPSAATIKKLKTQLKGSPHAAHELWKIYRTLPRKRLASLARNDHMAQSVLESRILPNTALDTLTRNTGRFSRPHLVFELQSVIKRYRDAVDIIRRGRSPIAPDDPVKGGTVGAATTDISHLEKPVIGASRNAGGEFNPGSSFGPGIPFSDPMGPATHAHAEQQIADHYHELLQNMDTTDLNGKTIWMLIEQEPCTTCRQDLNRPQTSGGGVLKKFSQAYPMLRIEVKNLNTNERLIIKAGIPLAE